MPVSGFVDVRPNAPLAALRDVRWTGAGTLAGGILMTMHRLSQGGADRVGILLANGFVRAGIPTRLALLRDGGEAEQSLRDLAHPDLAIVHAGPAMGSRHLELARGLRFIRSQIAETHPALVLASSNNMGMVTGAAARLAGHARPYFAMKVTNPVVRPHETGPIRKAYRHSLYGHVFSPFDRILTLSDAERDTILSIYPQLAAVLCTVANPYVSPDMHAAEAGRESGKPQILALARMMPQKRLDILLRAFARVARTDARLTILGDGPERAKLEALAQSLGIAARVTMPGFSDNVVAWLQRSDLFVLSSDYEGLPAAAVEALACNVPVVTTNCFPGAHALLAHADRCAVTPLRDIDAFAAAIDLALRDGAPPQGLPAIAAPYTVQTAISAHIEALRPLLDNRGTPNP